MSIRPGRPAPGAFVHLLLPVLSAGMGPFGEAEVRFELEAAPGGTLVRFEELPARGAARLVWRFAKPAVTLALWGRNAASMSALAEVVRRGG